MQRTVSRTTLHAPQQAADAAYWLAQPLQARIEALEALRRQATSDSAHADIQLQRVCRVTQLKPS